MLLNSQKVNAEAIDLIQSILSEVSIFFIHSKSSEIDWETYLMPQSDLLNGKSLPYALIHMLPQTEETNWGLGNCATKSKVVIYYIESKSKETTIELELCKMRDALLKTTLKDSQVYRLGDLNLSTKSSANQYFIKHGFPFWAGTFEFELLFGDSLT